MQQSFVLPFDLLFIVLQFSGQGGLSCNPLLGYDFLVYWWPIESPDDGKRTNVSDTKLKSMTITGLTPCTEYNVSMTVRNFVGVESALSVPVTTTTSSDSECRLIVLLWNNTNYNIMTIK